MYRRFGSEVTVVEMSPRLISHEDEEVSAAVQGVLEAEGIAVRTSATCVSLAPTDGGVSVARRSARKARPASRARICSSRSGACRTPTTLVSTAAGVELDARGYIVVDDELRTGVPGIWAVGDCNGRGAFTHTSLQRLRNRRGPIC